MIESGVVSTDGANLAGTIGTDRTQEDEVKDPLPVCDCGKETAFLLSHADSCTLKQFCLPLCQGSAVEIAAAWYSCGQDARDAMEAYLGEENPALLEEVQRVLMSDATNDDIVYEEDPEYLTGEASATYEDVTVDAVGVPEGSSLTIGEPSAEAVQAVEDYVAKVDTVPEQLFLYDISVQNEESDDWQPESASVQLSLSLENVDLPKYTIVKVVHVDDAGNVSVVEGTVDGEGKINFETDGFSTFAGFTVDFAYGSAFYSMKGLTSMHLSDLFDQLQMPLYASEVVNVTFTDTSLLTVEQTEGDWLLTSLKAFTTQELLTFTMSDGRVFNIHVTDATVPTITANGVQGDKEGGSGTGNGYVQWKADGDGELSNTNEIAKVGWSQSGEILISGTDTFKIYVNANKGSVTTTTEELYINLYKIRITGGADVTFYLNGDVSTSANDETSFGQDGYKHIKRVVVRGIADVDTGLFQVSEGKLTLKGLPGTRLVLDGAKGSTQYIGKSQEAQLVYLGKKSTGFEAKYVTFRNAPYCGIKARPDQGGTFKMENCDFESTVNRSTFGGAIYVMQGTDNPKNTTDYSYTKIDEFILKNVDFNGTHAEQGGAIYLRGKIYHLSIDSACDFVNCEAKKKSGGAIYIDAAVGEATIKARFENCKAAWSGGAIQVASVACSDVPQVAEETGKTVYMTTRTNLLTLNGARFVDCQTLITGSETEGMGGAVHIAAQVYQIDIQNCTFTNCKSLNNKTNASGGAICFGYYNLVDNFQQTADGGDSYWTAGMINSDRNGDGLENNADEWGGSRRSKFYTWEATQSDGSIKTTNRTTIGTVNISGTKFTDCYAGFHGGAFMVRTGACIEDLNCSNLTIDGCVAEDRGSAIFFNNCIVNTADFTDCTIKNCEITNTASLFGGTMTTVGTTTMVLTVDNCTFENNVSYDSGGGLYWNAGNPRIKPLSETEKEKTDKTQYIITPKATVKNCTFKGNEATTRFGGGIFSECEMDIIACTFDGNKAHIGGGVATGVYNNNYRMMRFDEKMELILDAQTSFYNNSADYGGAISVRANASDSLVNYPEYPYYDAENNVQVPEIVHTVIFQLGGAQIYNNSATQYGGGIYFMAETYADAGDNLEVQHYNKTIKIDGGDVYGNTAGKHGGGIYMNGSKNTHISVEEGVIYNNESGVTVSGTTTTVTGGNGGGIYLSGEDADVTITGGTIYQNTANNGNGGGIYASGRNTVCKVNGGILGADANNAIYPNIATHGTVDGATVGGNGGGIALFDGGRIEMDGGVVVNNIATQAGGGVAVHADSTMYLKGGQVKNNFANYGGGISVNNSCGDSTSSDVTKKYGMYFSGGTVSDNLVLANGTIFNITISNDNDMALGGGICLSNSATMRLDDGTISENIAASTRTKDGDKVTYTYEDGAQGGGIAVCQNSEMDIYGGIVNLNDANAGGGIVVRGGATVNMYPSQTDSTKVGVVEENKVEYGGGGICCLGATVNLNGGIIQKNEATYGGGGFFDENAQLSMNGGKVIDNEVSYYGGGLLFCYATATINDGEINNNSAWEGGGLWLRNDGETAAEAPKVTIYGGSISGNTASHSGGGVHIHGKTKTGTQLTMYGGEVSNNTAGERGGGINADNWAEVLVSKYTHPVTGKVTYPAITGNTGGRGGGIFVCYGAQLTVEEGYITFNHAKGTPTKSTGYHELDALYGVGGGIGVGTGNGAAKPAKFTLQGQTMAIYGNTADFAGDDVFSNGLDTELTIPSVSKMDLAGYQFKPEAWFEDYPLNDPKYDQGTNLGGSVGVTNSHVFRYRNSASAYRILIDENNVTNKVNAAGSYVCMTLGIPAAVNDTVVSDFGLNMAVNVIDNDIILKSSEIKTMGYLSEEAPAIDNEETIFEYNGIVYGQLDENFSSGTVTLTGLKYGQATLDTETGAIVYEMGTSSLTMDEEDSFYYAVYHTAPTGGGYYYYGKVTVVPATSIYYEDNCGGIEYVNSDNATDTFGTWKDVQEVATDSTETDLSDILQGEDRPGVELIPGTDKDQLYGYDESYADGETFSMGSAKWVRVDENHDAAARFTFTGTGFDIISLCSNSTGLVMVDLFEGAGIPDITGTEYDTVYDHPAYQTTIMVDTFYGCSVKCYKYTYTYTNGQWSGQKEEIERDQLGISDPTIFEPKEGDVVIQYMTEITASGSSDDVTYQVPVVKCQDLAYGTYTAEIYVAYSPWMEGDRHPGNYCDFYLDAIRIYDPANNGADSKTIRDSYLADGEGWPVYQELRNMFITQEELTNKPTSGMVFMDGTNYAIGTYKHFGANNEVYLAKGETIGFKLDELSYMEGYQTSDFDTSEDSIVANIHLGIKGLEGKGAVTITNGTTTLNLTPGSTEMFYDITSMKNTVVTVTNTGNSIISLTNVKITHTQEPVSASGYSARILTVDEDTVQEILEQSSGAIVEPTVPTLTPKYPTLTFEGEINYNIYFEAQGMDGLHPDRFGLAVFSTKDTEGTVGTADAVLSGAVQDGELLVVSTEGIPAKKLGDTMYFKVYAMLEDGTLIYSPVFGYSAQNYAKSVLNSATATVKQKTLVVAMLNYGAAAQTYFGYNTEALMNSIITEDQQALVSGFSADSLNAVVPAEEAKCGSFASNGGFTDTYPTVSFEGAFQIQYYFLPANLPDGDVNFCFWSQDTYESCETLTIENADLMVPMTVENGEYMGVSPEVAAKDLDKTLYVAAYYEADGVTYSSGVLAYSLAKYCKTHAANAMSNMNAFASAAAIYGCAAKNYFAQ